MTTASRLEADLPRQLSDLVDPASPDDLRKLLTQTASLPQRKPWTILEWWLPGTSLADRLLISQRVPGLLIALLVLMVALAVGAALTAGSIPHRLEPFGPAANGLVVFSTDGDIFTADPVTGAVRPVVAGPGRDVEPRWSRDGTHFLFYRDHGGAGDLGRLSLYVARADGTDVTAITPEPLVGIGDATFSPDGSKILFVAPGGIVSIAQADGRGSIQVLDLPTAAAEAAFRPPDGSEVSVLFGNQISVVNVDGSDLRTIVPPDPKYSIGEPTWSPDGSQLAYIRWVPVGQLSARIRIVRPNTGESEELPMGPGAVWEGEPSWSNDGNRLAIARGYSPLTEHVVAAIVPVPGGGRGVETDPSLDVLRSCCLDGSFEWAPDDTWILFTPKDSTGDNGQQTFIDPATGESRVAEWAATSGPSWQRLP